MSKLFLLPSELLTQNDIDRINRMFPRIPSPKKTKQFGEARALACPVTSEQHYNIWAPEINPLIIKHEESLMGHRPIVSQRLPSAIAMKYRILTFGVGSTNDVPLDRFGYCNYISPKHAVLFYDDLKRQFELLNYSCYGTYVNNNLAANNEICKDIVYLKNEEKEVYNDENGQNEETTVQVCKSSSISLKSVDRKSRPMHRSLIKSGVKKCFCTPTNFENLTTGWEGSIPVPFGSVLRFGCMSFIFSITNLPNETVL